MRKLSEKSSAVLFCVFSMMLLLQYSFSKSCIQNELEALLQFKRSFGSFDHNPYYLLASWNGTNCCNWKGVGCNQTTGHVTMIDLRYDVNQVNFYLPLYGNSIDSSLLKLKYLNYLDLSGNDFGYTIPNFLGSMVELRYLNFSRVSISGKVPPHLGNLTKLETLDLSFTWPKPSGDVEWLSHLSSLKLLWLREMDFSNAPNLMRVLHSLPLLVSLRLRECSNLQNFNYINLSFGSSLNYSSFLSRIQLLDLSGNQLNGPIPKAFENMTSLKYLDLSQNRFSTIFEGGISTIIGNNCDLKVLDLSWNTNLGGDVFGSYKNESMGCGNGYHDLQVLSLRGISTMTEIPDWLGKLKNLKSIDLQRNKIYGPISTSLGNLSSLEYLDLSSNNLTGAIPSSFGNLLNLRELYLRENRLVEVGNKWFTKLEKLELLDISGNLLKGVLTEAHFANLSRLHTLRIGYNELLSLNMKSNWIPPFQLQVFDASSSCMGCFGSDFPHWLETQKSLVELWLSNTSLSISCLPTWFTPNNLTSLDLSYSKIVGPLFTNIAHQMPNLQHLFLNNNFINDSLPSTLCKFNNLFTLDLSNNRLSGMVQGCLLTSNIMFLDLSSNNFLGNFPYSHENNLSNIVGLFLRNNNFEGSLPNVLKNSKFLETLDLEGNKFSGNIPTWVGDNLESLQILKLRSNLFNGTIPSSLCNLADLQILDLAHNQLDGIIPSNLSNFDAMTQQNPNGLTLVCRNDFPYHGVTCDDGGKYVVQSMKSSYLNYSMMRIMSMVSIDLSSNSLVGFIPSEVTKLKMLIGLNLSHNNLIGIVPAEIGKMESLESLDLSFNQLFGPIPRSLSKLNSLGMLRLSHNNFSGDIPREGHLSTFNEVSSFDNNSYLCGEPLPVKCVFGNPSEPPFNNTDNKNQEEDKWEKWLLYVMIILGFIIGFWTVIGSLILKKSWRHNYFNFVDDISYKVLATIWRCVKCLKEPTF